MAQIQKIAVAVDEENNIFAHFGKCEKFAVYELEDNQVVKESVLEATEDAREAMADWLTEQGVQVLICGGIGYTSMQDLMAKHIMVVPGQQGTARTAVENFLQ